MNGLCSYASAGLVWCWCGASASVLMALGCKLWRENILTHFDAKCDRVSEPQSSAGKGPAVLARRYDSREGQATRL